MKRTSAPWLALALLVLQACAAGDARDADGAAAFMTSNVEAQELYDRARHHGEEGEAADHEARGAAWRQALVLYADATSLDADFAAAWSGRAFEHLRLYWYGYDRTGARLDSARVALDRAVALAPTAPEVQTVQGYWYYWAERDYDRAVQLYRAAQSSQPENTQLSNLIAYVLRRQGTMQEAAELLASGSDAEPGSSALALEAGDTYAAVRDWDRALVYLERAIASAPEHPAAHLSRAHLYLAARGDVHAARDALETGARMAGARNFVAPLYHLAMLERRWSDALRTLDSAEAEAIESPIVLLPIDQLAGFALAALGDSTAAQRRFRTALERLEEWRSQYGDDHRVQRAIALNHAALGNRDAALAAITRGVENRPLSADAYVGGDPVKDRAWVHVLLGMHDAAIEDLALLLRAQTLAPLTPALLRLDPRWDALRALPAFRALIDETQAD